MLVAFLIFEAICLAALMILLFSERHLRRRLPEAEQPLAIPQAAAPEAGEDTKRQAA